MDIHIPVFIKYTHKAFADNELSNIIAAFESIALQNIKIDQHGNEKVSMRTRTHNLRSEAQ